ncbi:MULTISPECIES: OadG family protein [unclassified Nitratiruptor]|uniref:OadG family protein n=1 Tax=unclassified Nitratiruptor TaxID=2624044 RepID=UPI001916499B|nr:MULTISPECIES: OadG family transporter subunit [unclassified Nitratiruptor]BCD60619.1 oxaloacetate decarboxylase (Na+ extruding) subunit gamma [Nitratiruptor sp. YY08-10]BCD64550.1 oxaloacetate decarboxylase (Na+ extruding) subunit gamma [Nitratiruptor sp. YY08-14]
MILEAVKYMILGMGVVYLFLMLMIWVLDWQHKLLLKYFPESFEEPKAEESVTSKREKLKKVAAITAALHHMKNS